MNSGKLTRPQWKMIVLASLGGGLEFYDFIIYGVFAQYIAAQFFPTSDPLVSLTLSFSVFGVGFVARPLGGVVLSGLGDRYGRRPVFIASILTISLATIGMGLLPSYATWGIAAPICLVALRLIQGFCLGGELPGSITYAVEAAPRRAGFACGIIIGCVNAGVLIATLVSLGIHAALPVEQVQSFGWRIGFLLGGFFGLLSYWVRNALEESPEFEKMRTMASQHPFREVIHGHGKAVLAGACIAAVIVGFNGIMFGHMPAYLVKVLGYDATQAMLAQNLFHVVSSTALVAAGWLSDRVPRQYLVAVTSSLLIILTYPFYAALADKTANLFAIFFAGAIVFAFASGTWASLLADLFPTRVRFSGIALSYNVSSAVFGGLAPVLATSLIARTGNVTAPAFFIIGCAALALIACLFVGRLSGQIVSERNVSPVSSPSLNARVRVAP